MKTHLLHLEQDDNVISIIDKLSWGKAQRVLLVYPVSPGLRLKKYDLLLIKRAAIKQGFSLGIVSRKTEVKLLADELKIPVFNSIKNAQRRTWASLESDKKNIGDRKNVEELWKMSLHAKSSKPIWLNRMGVRLFIFTLGVLSVLLISLLFIPSANIKLNLPEDYERVQFKIVADNTIDSVNLSGTIPVHKIEITVKDAQVVSINSQANVPDKYSVGKILFTNLTESQIEIPLGTIIAGLDNIGIRFETIEKGDIPAGIGQTIELSIRALTPGEAGNVDANTLGSLIGELGTSLSVINPEKCDGGTDRITKIANENDREELFRKLETDLKIKALQEAQDQLAKGDIIFPDTAVIDEIVEKIYVPVAGQPGDRLSLELNLNYTIQYAAYSDLVNLGELALKAELSPGYIPVPGGSINIDLLSKPKTALDGKTTISLQADQKVRKEFNSLFISRLIQGKTIQETYKILNEELGSGVNPIVEVTPPWWPWLPGVTLRIAVSN